MAVKLEKIVKTYYDNLEEGKILGRYCPKCGGMEWPPVYACNLCGNMETEWKEISGEGGNDSVCTSLGYESKAAVKGSGALLLCGCKTERRHREKRNGYRCQQGK